MADIRQILASNMKRRRAELGLSQERLSEKAETSPNYIAAIEAGLRYPSLRILEKIAAGLEIETHELFSTESIRSASLDALKIEVLQDISDCVETCIDKKLHALRGC
jgi:transcriptional regulator with XRE-family HTH domain